MSTMETYNGHVRTPADAIVLFEACRIGQLPRVQRRLSEKERQQIKSGSVFVWDEREAGMRRWTDGKSWSASRVSGSFLTYREMEGKRGGNGFSQPQQPPKKAPSSGRSSDGGSDEDGPDGYRYKPDGLMKQSFSITTSTGQHLHLISYYARQHATSNSLMQPSNDPTLRNIRPPKGMYPESTVNEPSSVPPVTRGPMPGSPYAGMPSPYAHAPAHWPPTPGHTPPYHYAAWHPAGPPPGHPQHSPYSYTMYGSQLGPPTHPVQGPTFLDRPPPHLTNPSLPPPPPGMANGHHPPPHHQQYHYPQHHPVQAPHMSHSLSYPSAPAYAAPPTSAPYSADARLAPVQSQPYQYAQSTATAALAANNGVHRQPSPNAQAQAEAVRIPNEVLNVPESTTNGARTVPSVGALLNGNPPETHNPSVSAESRSQESGSRAGSRSPNAQAQQRPLKDLPSATQKFNNLLTDTDAKRKLDRAFAS